MSENDPKVNEGAWQDVPGHSAPQPSQQTPVQPQGLPQNPGQGPYMPPQNSVPSPPQGQMPYGQPVYAGQGYAPPYGYAPVKKKNHLWAWLLGIGGSVVLLGLVGCLVLAHTWGQMLGATQVSSIHDSMKKDDADTIYALASPMYRDQVGQARSDAMFHTVYSHLGAPISTTIVDNKVMSEGGGKVRYITAKTVFEKGTGTEEFRFYDNLGALTLLGYNISSHALLDVPFGGGNTGGQQGTTPGNWPTPQQVTPVSR